MFAYVFWVATAIYTGIKVYSDPKNCSPGVAILYVISLFCTIVMFLGMFLP